jgi:hypothetical protein
MREEIIADNLSKAGWSLGWVSAVDLQGRTIWIVDAHRGDGKRFIVRADEKLTEFVELERAIQDFALRWIFNVAVTVLAFSLEVRGFWHGCVLFNVNRRAP